MGKQRSTPSRKEWVQFQADLLESVRQMKRGEAVRTILVALPPAAEACAKVWVDPDDAPELTEEYFAEADQYHGDKLIRRGRARPHDSEDKS